MFDLLVAPGVPLRRIASAFYWHSRAAYSCYAALPDFDGAHGLMPDFSCRAGVCETGDCELGADDVGSPLAPPQPSLALICGSIPAVDISLCL